jgi:hypothetical protein
LVFNNWISPVMTVVNTPASYSWGPGFKFHPRNWLSCWTFCDFPQSLQADDRCPNIRAASHILYCGMKTLFAAFKWFMYHFIFGWVYLLRHSEVNCGVENFSHVADVKSCVIIQFLSGPADCIWP